jgi:hypothetical protein
MRVGRGIDRGGKQLSPRCPRGAAATKFLGPFRDFDGPRPGPEGVASGMKNFRRGTHKAGTSVPGDRKAGKTQERKLQAKTFSLSRGM